MQPSRSFLLVFMAPLLTFILLGTAIFGGQAFSEGQENIDIQRAIADALDSTSGVELAKLQPVRGGTCGTYRVEDTDKGYASFFYDSFSRKIVLDVTSQKFTANCGLSAFC